MPWTLLGALEPRRKMSRRVVKSQQRQTRGSRSRCGVNRLTAQWMMTVLWTRPVAVGMQRMSGFRKALGDGGGRSWWWRREAAGFVQRGYSVLHSWCV